MSEPNESNDTLLRRARRRAEIARRAALAAGEDAENGSQQDAGPELRHVGEHAGRIVLRPA